MHDNVALRVLSMAWCGMQDAGTEAVANMLKENNVRRWTGLHAFVDSVAYAPEQQLL